MTERLEHQPKVIEGEVISASEWEDYEKSQKSDTKQTFGSGSNSGHYRNGYFEFDNLAERVRMQEEMIQQRSNGHKAGLFGGLFGSLF